MRTRGLGQTDLQLTTLGLGTWAIGGSAWRFGWGPSDDAAAVRALVHGIERGVNWIDTAPIYGDGHAEALVGRALAELGPARRPWVATKCGRIMGPDGVPFGRLTRDSVVAECEASLRRLGVDAVDLYQIHWPDPEDGIEEAWDAIGSLIDAGKVRHGGVSNFDSRQLARLHAIRPVASLQPPYSLLRRGIEDATLPWCKHHGVGVVAYSPMQKGLLSGALTRERVAGLGDDDHRARDPEFREPLLSRNLTLVDGLREVAARQRATVAQLAIAWVLRRPEVTAAIVGVRSPDQVDGLLPAADLELSAETVGAVEVLLATRG